MDKKKELEIFFSTLDCYLLGDLHSMLDAKPSGDCGGCGYSILQCVFAGCEMLGRISSGNTEGEAFAYFIKNYFSGKYKAFASKKMYGFIRSPSAHFFLSSMRVYKGGEKHLVLEDGEFLSIEVNALTRDFESAYAKLKLESLSEEKVAIRWYFYNQLIQKEIISKGKLIANEFKEFRVADASIASSDKVRALGNKNGVAVSAISSMNYVASGASLVTESMSKALQEAETLKIKKKAK